MRRPHRERPIDVQKVAGAAPRCCIAVRDPLQAVGGDPGGRHPRAVPPGNASASRFYAYVVPVLVPCSRSSLAAPHATIDAMTGAQASIALGHRQLWTSAFVPLRSRERDAVAAALARRRAGRGMGAFATDRRCRCCSAAIGLVMLARLVCEPTIFAYYLGPALAFAILCAALHGEPIGLRTVCALTLQCWCGCPQVPERCGGSSLVSRHGVRLCAALGRAAARADARRPRRRRRVPSLA